MKDPLLLHRFKMTGHKKDLGFQMLQVLHASDLPFSTAKHTDYPINTKCSQIFACLHGLT